MNEKLSNREWLIGMMEELEIGGLESDYYEMFDEFYNKLADGIFKNRDSGVIEWWALKLVVLMDGIQGDFEIKSDGEEEPRQIILNLDYGS